jgi:putative glutamine amidotransferase
MKPLIGLTMYGRIERPVPSEHYEEHFSVPVVYVEAIRRAGGVPVLLPPGETDTGRWLDGVDGVLIAGGTDIDPGRYGRPRTPVVLIADTERDDSEIALTREVLERDVPTLFVCRGMQMLNVALGGTLHAHIPDLGIGDIHRDKEGMWAYHDIEAVEGSRVAAAMGATSVMTYSGHHQAIDGVASGLTITASAPDGIIEALEVDDASWAVGVQWHPEVSAHDDPTQQALFDRLVASAG